MNNREDLRQLLLERLGPKMSLSFTVHDIVAEVIEFMEEYGLVSLD